MGFSILIAWNDWLRWLYNFLRLERVAALTGKALLHGAAFLLLICILERYYRVKTDKYKRAGFWHDVVFWFYYYPGFHQLLISTPLLGIAANWIAPFRLHLFDSMPLPVLFVVSFVFRDLIMYLFHRWEHASPFLWEFHKLHHSQEDLTFATQSRNHPFPMLIVEAMIFVPMLILGARIEFWPPFTALILFQDALEHSEVPWGFGPFHRIFVSPNFHSLHHSTNPAHHNKNFAVLLSFWDYLFGTAVESEQRPAQYGLPGVKMETLRSQWLGPIVTVLDIYVRRPWPVLKTRMLHFLRGN